MRAITFRVATIAILGFAPAAFCFAEDSANKTGWHAVRPLPTLTESLENAIAETQHQPVDNPPVVPPSARQVADWSFANAAKSPSDEVIKFAAEPIQKPVQEALPTSMPSFGQLPPQAERPIALVTVNITPPAGKLPGDPAAALIGSGIYGSLPPVRLWPIETYYWAAAATRHNPLYFEEVNAERYGYTRCQLTQPFVSAAHFFGTLPALPYLMGADCPRECDYTLGHYRPGSCVPWQRHYWPVSLRGAAVQAGIVTGTVFVIP